MKRLVVLAACLAPSLAHADYSYKWVTTSINGLPRSDLSTSADTFFPFTPTAAGLDARQMSADTHCDHGGVRCSGSSFGLVPLGPEGWAGVLRMNVSLLDDGTLSGSINYGGEYYDLRNFSGSGLNWSGSILSDNGWVFDTKTGQNFYCGSSTACTITGYWTAGAPLPAPEPASFALLATGVLGFASACRRARGKVPGPSLKA